MDTLKSLIGVLIRIMFAAFFVAFVWWLVSLLYPSISMLSVKPIIFGEGTKDILPSPRVYSNFIQRAKTPTWESNTVVFDGPIPFEGVQKSPIYSSATYSYVTYGASGAKTEKEEQQEEVKKETTTTQKELFIRNLSLYNGGSVRQGLSFVGEARSSMFRNGSFPIILVDQNKKVIGVSAAVALSHWSIPGWVRFETTINYQIPVQSPCMMIFQEALTEAEYTTRQPVSIPLSVRCN